MYIQLHKLSISIVIPLNTREGNMGKFTLILLDHVEIHDTIIKILGIR